MADIPPRDGPAPVWLYVAKFGREVLIDADHPLAVAQRDALGAALPVSGSGEPGQSGAHPAEPRRRRPRRPVSLVTETQDDAA